MADNKDPKKNRKPGDTLEGWQIFAIGCLVGFLSWYALFEWIFA